MLKHFLTASSLFDIKNFQVPFKNVVFAAYKSSFEFCNKKMLSSRQKVGIVEYFSPYEQALSWFCELLRLNIYTYKVPKTNGSCVSNGFLAFTETSYFTFS